MSATGRNVEGAEAFAAANAEARRQVALLRVEGLKTAATFRSAPVRISRAALGPGIQAGLSPDEVRGFAVRIAQAAAAIGLPQNQLAEEVRSILAGTITQRTTRIAAVLGIGNDDIRRAREAGELADFLLDRFSAFQFAGEASLQNFSVIIANLRDATSQLLGAGGQGFFQNIQFGLQQILATLIQTSSRGTIINPEAVRIVQQFFSILDTVRAQLIEIFDSFTLEGAADTAEGIADTINTIVILLGGFAEGFVDAFTQSLEILQDIGEFSAQVAEALGIEDAGFLDTLRDAAGFWGEIVGFAVAFQAVILLVRSPIFLIAAAVKGIQGSLALLAPALRIVTALFSLAAIKVGLIVLAVVAIVGAIALVVAAFESDFVRSIEIGGLKIGTIADLIAVGLVLAIRRAAFFFERAWTESIQAVRSLFVRLANFFIDRILGIVQTVLSVASYFSDAAENAEQAIQRQRNLINQTSADIIAAGEAEKQARLAAIAEEERAFERQQNARLAAIARAENASNGISLSDAANTAIERARSILGFGGEAADNQEELNDLAEEYVDTFSNLPATIGQSNIKLEQQAQILERLTNNVERSQSALDFAVSAQSLEGAERRLLRERVRAISEVTRAANAFDVRIRQSNQALDNIAAKEGAITVELAKQEKISADTVQSLVEEGARLQDLVSQRRTAATASLALQRQIDLAGREGDDERAEALRGRLELIDEEARKLDQQVAAAEAAVRAQVQSSQLTQAEGEKVLEQVSELIRLQAQRALQQGQIANATRERGRVEDLVNEALEDRLQAILLLEKERLRTSRLRADEDLRNAQLAIEAARLTSGVGGELGGTANQAQREVAAGQARLNTLTRETEELARQFELRRRSLEAQIEATDNAALREELQGRINTLTDTFNTQLDLAKVNAAEIAAELQRLSIILDQPITAGLRAGLEDFVVEAGDSFEQVRQIAENSIDGLASSISQTLGDALDPTKDLDLVGRFRSFFQEITNQILQLIVRLLIVRGIVDALGLGGGQGDRAAAEAAAGKAVVAAATAAAAAASAQAAAAQASAASIGGGAVFGFNEGGLIGSKFRGFSMSHARAQGLAAGGQPRPSGLHPSDTVPIWAALGEFMQPVRAVQTYGLRFMEAIRQRKLDPNLARSMVSSGTASRVRTNISRRGAGYVDGGRIDGSGTVGSDGAAPVTIVNVFDRQQLLQTLSETEGQEVLVNVMRARSEDLTPAQ